MFLDTLEIATSFSEKWLFSVRKDDFVWLVKQQQLAQIEWEYQDDICMGRLGFYLIWKNNDSWRRGELQSWYVKPDGTGFDGSQLILPIKQCLNEKTKKVSRSWEKVLYDKLTLIEHKIEVLEKDLRKLEERV